MQELLIIVLFAIALGYLGYRAYLSFATKRAGCGKGCGCSTDATAAAPARSRRVESSAD